MAAFACEACLPGGRQDCRGNFAFSSRLWRHNLQACSCLHSKGPRCYLPLGTRIYNWWWLQYLSLCLVQEFGWPPLSVRREQRYLFIYKVLLHKLSPYIVSLIDWRVGAYCACCSQDWLLLQVPCANSGIMSSACWAYKSLILKYYRDEILLFYFICFLHFVCVYIYPHFLLLCYETRSNENEACLKMKLRLNKFMNTILSNPCCLSITIVL